VTENPYESPTAIDSISDGPPPKLGLGTWLLVAFEAIVTFVVLIVLAALPFAWLWPADVLPAVSTPDRLARWLIPYYIAGSFFIAAALSSYQASCVLHRHRARAARKAEIDQQRREAIESARQRHE